MPQIAYRVPGVPPLHAGAGSTAFTPIYGGHAASSRQAYKYDLVGTIGRVRVDAPTGATQMDRGPAAVASQGSARSSDAPDAWWPQTWFQASAAERPGAGMPVQVYSPTQAGLTSLLPVPAMSYRQGYQADSARLARRTILQRMRSLPWFPRVYNVQTGSWNG